MGHYGVVFNSNRELLRNYHAEKRFELHHYTCAGWHIFLLFTFANFYLILGIYVTMTVDNRGQDEEEVGNPGTLQRQNSKGDIKELDGGNAMQVNF